MASDWPVMSCHSEVTGFEMVFENSLAQGHSRHRIQAQGWLQHYSVEGAVDQAMAGQVAFPEREGA